MKPRPPRNRRTCAECKQANCRWCIFNDPLLQGWRKDTNPDTGETRYLCYQCYQRVGWETADRRDQLEADHQTAAAPDQPRRTTAADFPTTEPPKTPPPLPPETEPIPEPPPFPSRRAPPGELRKNLRSYYTAWHQFVQWCRNNRRRPFPATPQVVQEYLRQMRDQGAQPSSILHHKVAIILIHDHYGITPNPGRQPGFQTPS